MSKPKSKTKTITFLDYHDCADFIADKLGVEDLRDFAGKWLTANDKNTPYQDFWHFLCDHNEVHNGGIIFMPEICYDMEDWQKKIVTEFVKEFGEDAEYWVEW